MLQSNKKKASYTGIPESQQARVAWAVIWHRILAMQTTFICRRIQIWQRCNIALSVGLLQDSFRDIREHVVCVKVP